MDAYIYQDKKKLRCGYTTGACAALAAKSAVRCLVSDTRREEETILVPGGLLVRAKPEDWRISRDKEGRIRSAECAVKKDAGDDHDATDGILIYVRAEYAGDASKAEEPDSEKLVFIEGGEGIGRLIALVTAAPGKQRFFQPPGQAAQGKKARTQAQPQAASQQGDQHGRAP